MDIDTLKEYVTEYRKAGQSDQQIKTAFYAKGWPEELVNQLLLPPSIPDTNSAVESIPIEPKLSGKFSLKFIFGILFLIVAFISISILLIYRQISGRIRSQLPQSNYDTAALTNNPISAASEIPLNSIGPNLIAYVVDNAQVMIYDVATENALPSPPEFQDPEMKIYKIGRWSPKGTYLPILAHSDPQKSPRKVILYFYDALNQKVLKVAEANDPDFTNDEWAFSSMSFAVAWLDDMTFAYSVGPNDGLLEYKYITKDGTQGKNSYPNQFITRFDKYKYKINFARADQSSSGLFMDEAPVSLKISGSFLGISENAVVSYFQPAAKNLYQLGANGTGIELNQEFKKKAEEINKKNLSAEQKQEEILKLIKPTEDSVVYLSDIKTNSQQSIYAQNPDWNIFSARYIPTINSVILHLTDHNLQPTKERIMSINLNKPYRAEELITRDVTGLFELPGSQRLYTGSSFSVTLDSQWVVLVLGNVFSTSSIDMVNILTKERKTICSEKCNIPEVLTPLQFNEVYER